MRKFRPPFFAWVSSLFILFTLPVAAQPKTLVVTTMAGLANFGDQDGLASTAKFLLPAGVAVDASGDVYVADASNDTIRKVSTNGIVSTVAGLAQVSGFVNATSNAARFYLPYGVAVDSFGNIFVADYYNNAIREIATNGTVTTITTGTNLPFYGPYGVAVDSSNNVYVADTYNNMIRKISNGVVTTLAGSINGGASNGMGTNAQFSTPYAVATDAAGNVYVADTGNNLIRRITPAGVVTTIAGSGGATFSSPSGIAVDSGTNIYVADTDNEVIRKLTLSGTTNWVLSTLAGNLDVSGDGDGIYPLASFFSPWGVAVDSATNVYVGDTYNGNIRKISAAGVVSTLAGPDGSYGGVDGSASQARFNEPNGVAVDGATNLYVADTGNNCIRQITPAGVVSTLAGLEDEPAGSVDGTNTNARFDYPSGIALDGATNLYVADYENSTIRKITPDATHSNWVTTTFAGKAGTYSFSNGVGTNAFFDGPYAVAVDSATNLYVTDTGNNAIRKITPGGVVSLYAGNPGVAAGFQNGTGTNSLFNQPLGITVDSSTNVYVADSGNNAIREITPSGVVSTLVQGSATFDSPQGIAVDKAGNVYVADSGNNNILGITPGGKITTNIAGTVGIVGSADGLGTAAQFDSPIGLAVDSSSNVYVADDYNNTIRKGTPDTAQTAVLTLAASPSGFALGLNGTNFPSTPQTFALTSGSTNTAMAAATSNYAFTGWTVGGIAVSASNNYTFVLNSNETVVANFVPGYTIAVSASPANGGTAAGAGTFAVGSTNTVTATTNSGYVFTGWTTNGTLASSSNSYSFVLTTNITLVANFLPVYTITLSASPTNGGTISGGGTFAAGTTNTITARANIGFFFTNWTQGGNLASLSSNYTFTLNSNVFMVANFLTKSSPLLSITHSNGLIYLLWTNSATGFTLQSTTNVKPANWVAVTNVSVVSGQFFTVSNALSNQMRFFRLLSQ